MYQQKMCYIDQYKDGFRCGNMGHVRLEWEDERYRFAANLCRLDKHTLVTAVIKGGAGGQPEIIDNIGIIRGRGSYQSDWRDIRGDEEQLIFEASGGVTGVCELPQMCGKTPADEAVQVPIPAEKPVAVEKQVPAENIEKEPEAVVEKEAALKVAERKEEPIREQAPQKRDMLEEIRKEREVLAASKLLENKWEQLRSMYENVRPVDGDIEFIKITPEDFVILRQEYQSLVRNSFLLHGYYNYRYILLGKYPDKYYIGVPGIMHEQERMAAAMFGFIGFEKAAVAEGEDARADEKDASRQGNFGYYMMEVAI